MIIRLVGYLKEIGGFHEKEFHLTKAVPLKDIISFPNLRNERFVVLINEKGASLDSFVENDDEIKILPVVGGG